MSKTGTPLNLSPEEYLEWNTQELIAIAEDIQLHHGGRDADFIKPEELRELLRAMYYSLLGLHERLREGSSDKS